MFVTNKQKKEALDEARRFVFGNRAYKSGKYALTLEEKEILSAYRVLDGLESADACILTFDAFGKEWNCPYSIARLMVLQGTGPYDTYIKGMRSAIDDSYWQHGFFPARPFEVPPAGLEKAFEKKRAEFVRMLHERLNTSRKPGMISVHATNAAKIPWTSVKRIKDKKGYVLYDREEFRKECERAGLDWKGRLEAAGKDFDIDTWDFGFSEIPERKEELMTSVTDMTSGQGFLQDFVDLKSNKDPEMLYPWQFKDRVENECRDIKLDKSRLKHAYAPKVRRPF